MQLFFFIFPTGWYGYKIELSHRGKKMGTPIWCVRTIDEHPEQSCEVLVTGKFWLSCLGDVI